MGKDLQSKNLLNCPDVFSDIGNVNLFEGEEIIRPEELEQLPTEIIYKDNYGTMRHHYLDTRMKVTEHNTDIAIFCIENQSGVSNIMPVRNMGYLYSNYNEQIKKIQKEDKENKVFHITDEIGEEKKLVPVISIILYYGQEKWTGPQKLSDMLAVPESWREKLRPYIADHFVKVIHLAGQDKKIREKYRSDFRHIVDYLACAGDREECRKYILDESREISHPEEYLDMMAAFSNDTRFASIRERVLEKRKEGEESVNMYSIAEELENIGKQKGRQEGKMEIIRNMLNDEQPPELISKYTKEPLEHIYQIRQEMPQFVREELAYKVEESKEEEQR